MSDLKAVHEAYYLANESDRNYTRAIQGQFGPKATRWTVDKSQFNEITSGAQADVRFWNEVYSLLAMRENKAMTLNEARKIIANKNN